jgi:hypothetical protein
MLSVLRSLGIQQDAPDRCPGMRRKLYEFDDPGGAIDVPNRQISVDSVALIWHFLVRLKE